MKKFWIVLSVCWLWTCGGGGGSTAPEPPQLPTVSNIQEETDEDNPITFLLAGIDPNNLTLTYSVTTQPQHGTVSINGAAATYTPNANYHGQDVIAYLASSTNGNSNIGTIIITINPVDDEPNSMDVSATIDEDNAVVITLLAEEVDGDNIEFQVRNNPSYGSVTISGTYAEYTPDENWNGTDTFNFEAVDSSARSVLNVATATITVNPVNDAPVANDLTAFMNENKDFNRFQPVTIPFYATDVEGDDLTYSIVGTPSNGALGSITNNQVVYTPTQDWNGEDTFTYKANDGELDSNTATVTVKVTGVNDAPVTTDQSATTDEDTAVDITLTATDVENDNLTFTIVSDVSNGTNSLSGATVTYTPTANFNGADTFTFKANDGTDDSNTSTVTITVASVNDAPVANDVTASTQSRMNNMRQAVAITLDATDVDGDDLTYSLVSNVSNGTTSLSGNVVTYTPNGGYDGTDTFTFKANDGELDSNTATGTITSTPARTYVPDDVFEKKLIDMGYDDFLDDYVDTFKMEQITNLLIQNLNVADVTGIEDMVNLQNLYLTNTLVDSIDLSQNFSELFRADFSGSSNLEYLNFGDNNFPKLEILETDNTILTSIDLSKLVDLKNLRVGSPLTELDVTNNLLLETLTIITNKIQITTLDLSQNLNLGSLTIGQGTTSVGCVEIPEEDTTYSGNLNSNVYLSTDCSNARPEVSDISSSTDEDVAIDITLNGTDEDGDDLTYTIVSDVSNGATSLSGSAVTYTPTANFNGTDTFTFKANDGIVDSKTSTVTITVNAI